MEKKEFVTLFTDWSPPRHELSLLVRRIGLGEVTQVTIPLLSICTPLNVSPMYPATNYGSYFFPAPTYAPSPHQISHKTYR